MDRQLEKQLNHGLARLGEIIHTSAFYTTEIRMPRCLRGQEDKLRWLRDNLPRSVFVQIGGLVGCTKGNNRNYRRARLELRWFDPRRPSIIFTKAKFRSDVTLARILLEAP